MANTHTNDQESISSELQNFFHLKNKDDAHTTQATAKRAKWLDEHGTLHEERRMSPRYARCA